jgi:hypothetical protein
VDNAVDKFSNTKFNQSLSPYLNRPLRSLHEVLGSHLESRLQDGDAGQVNCAQSDHSDAAEKALDSVAGG